MKIFTDINLLLPRNWNKGSIVPASFGVKTSKVARSRSNLFSNLLHRTTIIEVIQEFGNELVCGWYY